MALSRERARLKSRLDALVESHDRAAHRANDPVSFVHRFEDPADREVVGLIAASVAFGNVVAIRASVARALAMLGASPAEIIAREDRRALERRLSTFVHRVYRGRHLAAMLANAARVRREEGSLGASFARRLAAHGELREALAELADELRGGDPERGLSHLVPDPRAGSACKRLLLYLRWMCRPADGVDLGLWSVPASALVIPLDTHVHRIGRNLRLTERKDASWRTAEEITEALRAFDPDDPVKYDFALCHLGVSKECPSQRDEAKCARCVLRPVCRHWAAR
jgi:uncharacterized protein (TIGR02757 family)